MLKTFWKNLWIINHYKLKKDLDQIIKAVEIYLRNKVKIIAEAGLNHNGDFNKIIKLINIVKC